MLIKDALPTTIPVSSLWSTQTMTTSTSLWASSTRPDTGTSCDTLRSTLQTHGSSVWNELSKKWRFSSAWSALLSLVNNHVKLITHTQPFYSSFPGTTQVSQCQKKSTSGLYGTREDIRCGHTDNPAGCYSIRTNQRPTSFILPFLHRMPFLPQLSQFILAWDRHQICWLVYSVAWFHVKLIIQMSLKGN